MSNKINVVLFLDLLKRASCNYSIENVKMVFTSTSYRVGLRGQNSLIILSGDNDIISDIAPEDEWELNFSMVQKNIKPYFDLIIADDAGQVEIIMKEDKVIMKSLTNQTVDLHMCVSRTIDTYDRDTPKDNGEVVYETPISEQFIDTYQIIKKIASGFGKVYFSVKDGELFIEATDKTNSVTNGIIMKIGDTDYQDLSIPFEFKTFNNILTLVNGDYEQFSFRIGFIPKVNGAIVSFIKDIDGITEKYYQLSIRED